MDSRLVGVMALAASVAAGALFLWASSLPTLARVVVAPISIWWACQSLTIALSAGLSRPGPWPRDRRGRYAALAAAFIVGLWTGWSRLSLLALAVLSAYCLAERQAMLKGLPPRHKRSLCPNVDLDRLCAARGNARISDGCWVASD